MPTDTRPGFEAGAAARVVRLLQTSTTGHQSNGISDLPAGGEIRVRPVET